jgi:hypothetical protein
VFNSGMAFSQGEGLGPDHRRRGARRRGGLLVSLGAARGPAGAVAVGLVIGGALGNVTDRLFRSPALVPGRGGRLHRLPVVADLQRRRHGDHVGAVLLVLASVPRDSGRRGFDRRAEPERIHDRRAEAVDERRRSARSSRRARRRAARPRSSRCCRCSRSVAPPRRRRRVSPSTGRSVTSGKVRLDEGCDVEVDRAPPDRSVRRPDPAASPSPWSTPTTDVIVVDKPAGLVVHPGAGNPTAPS